VQTAGERQGKLEKKLDTSLTEFDELLLKERELLEERREASGGGGGGGAAGATGEEEYASGMPGGQQTDSSDQEYAGEDATGGSPDTPPGEPVESAPGAPTRGEQAKSDNARIPPDVGDGSDDDIVARQLREAAEKEEDPELREKLWDEYRAYKKGTKKSR
jgi:hypothetical protein